MAGRSRRVLVVLSYPDYLRLFGDVLAALRARGVDVVLAFDKAGKHEDSAARAAALGTIEWPVWQPGEWQTLLADVACAVDYMRFMTPEFHGKQYLRRRMDKYLPERFGRLRGVASMPPALVRLAHAGARILEAAAPDDASHHALLERVQPDAVIVSPVLLRGPGSVRQTQLVRAARRRGIPVAIAVGSWDHLSSKGLLRVRPDRLLVWNERQRQEAIDYHRIPAASITVTGAYPWQVWFEMEPTSDRDAFTASTGLPPGAPYVLYVGSSRGIAAPEAELAFVHGWLQALRTSNEPRVRDIAVMIRPHPGNREHWLNARFDGLGTVTVFPAAARPVFMRSDDVQSYYHSIRFSEAVVGINTSAMIEATIIGRPVFTVRQPNVAQAETVHFEYLTPAAGGSTVVADSFDEHAAQLADVLRDPSVLAAGRQQFIRNFIAAPAGSRPPIEAFADAVEGLTNLRHRPRRMSLWQRPIGALGGRVARAMASSARPPRRKTIAE